MNVPPGAKLSLLVFGANDITKQRLAANSAAIGHLSRVEGIDSTAVSAPKGSLQIVIGEATYASPVGDVIDLKSEITRLRKEIEKLATEVKKINEKLSNPNFISRAPEDIVAEQRQRRSQAEQTRDRLISAIERL